MAATPLDQPHSTHPASLLPLPHPRSTRVLHLNPGGDLAPIEGTLHLVDLADPNHAPYEAISYTWGPEPTPDYPPIPITIHGQQVLIRQNLHECLLRLRKPNETQILWNDFLCIDQDRLDEKSRQVAMIGDVFRGASRVRVWVGEHEFGSEMLFRGWPEEQQKKQEGGALGLVKGFDQMVLRRSKLSREESKRRADVWNRFFFRRYWGRTWIVQEIYQAKDIVVHCGEDEMSWETLIADRFEGDSFFDGISLVAVLNVPESARLGDKVLKEIQELNTNRRGLHDQSQGSFEDKSVLFFTEHFKHSWCSVPHDKIYGFLSMEGAHYQQHPITVNYSLSLPELVVSIYEQRLVHFDQGLEYTNWKRKLPEPEPVIASLRLNQKQRMEALRIVAQRATQTNNEIQKQRWQHVYSQLEFAVDRLWRRDKSVNAISGEDYGPELKWNETPNLPAVDEASELVDSSSKTRTARFRFNKDQYYVKIPTPFTRKSKE